MAIATPAYLKWRDGRPRWEPGPGLRQAGWPGRNLKSDAGAWLRLDEAIAEAGRLNADVAAWRQTGQRRRRALAPVRNPRSCRALYDLWLKSPYWRVLLLGRNFSAPMILSLRTRS